MLRHLHKISQIQLARPFYYSRNTHDILHDDHWSEESANSEDTVAIVESMITTLQKLSLVARNVSEMPIRVYNSLTDLDICVTYGTELTGMDLIFRHAPLLESLSLVGHIPVDIFSILPRDSTSLPKLKSFRLSCEDTTMDIISPEAVGVLSKFLHKRATLRRLFIRFAGTSWRRLSPLLPTIRSLMNLEVLGFHSGYEFLDRENFDQLASIFSLKIKALHFVVPWFNVDFTTLNVNFLWPLVGRIHILIDL
jgi:hypothetical protein